MSHVEEYLGNAGRERKTRFMNLVSSSLSLILVFPQILTKLLIADLAKHKDLYFSPFSNNWKRNFSTKLIEG